jgi:hypothetical protein
LSTLGGGGNRTRVLQYLTRASPGAACSAFLGPGDHASKTPTGPAAVRCPAWPRDRVRRWILLADARHRVEGIPGLTTPNSPYAARARSVRVELALIGLRSQDLRGHNRNPRPASPGSTTEVETVHPLLSCPAGMVTLPAIPDRTRTTPNHQHRFPARQDPPVTVAPRPSAQRISPAAARRFGRCSPRRRRGQEMAPAGAGGGRNAPAGADRQGRSRSMAGSPPR